MPIRINLLAEAQALEDLRRRDPVKRALWAGVFFASVMLAWSSTLQLKAMSAKRALSRLENQIASYGSEYQIVTEHRKRLDEVSHKLSALRQMATNRFLNGSLLNALQQSTIDDVQLMKLKADVAYTLNEEIKPKTNENNRVTPGKPASVIEKTVLTLEAKDSSPNPGDSVQKFIHTLATNSYFAAALGKNNEIRLANLSPPNPVTDSKPFALFSLECRYPEKTR